MWECLREDYRRLFGSAWPVWTGGVFYGLANVLLFIHYKPWSTLDGVLNWGDNLFGGLGVGNAGALSPLLRSGSVLNFGIVAGAFLAAGLAGRFAPARALPLKPALAAVLGGLLMGYGARLAFGCNVGAYFSGVASGSLHGWLWFLAALAGTYLGTRLRPVFGIEPTWPDGG